MVQQPYPVTAFRLIQVGGGHHNRYPFSQQGSKNPPEIAAGDRINPVGRFVQKQHLRGMDQGTAEPKFLLHATGKRSGTSFDKGSKAAHGQQAFTAWLPF